MKERSFLFLIFALLATACTSVFIPPTPAPTVSPTLTSTVTPVPTATETPLPTPTPTPTPTEVIDMESWNVTTDGKIFWRQKDLTLFGNQYFMVNDEMSSKLYEKLFTFICAINYHTAAIKYYGNRQVRNYTGTYTQYCNAFEENLEKEKLTLITIHPKTISDTRIWWVSTPLVVENRIDLSKFSIAIVNPEVVEKEGDYLQMIGRAKFKIVPIQIDESTAILQFVFSTELTNPDEEYGILGLNSDFSNAKNLEALIQIMNIVINRGSHLSTVSSEMVLSGFFTSHREVIFDHTAGSFSNPLSFYSQQAKGLKYLILR
ncbi:MAG: hypothetical protein QY329_15700 [Anaerolineales bacterium]|nr:MAG: hypothetical protein QY329_15700 [Anaerolineales bacterium]